MIDPRVQALADEFGVRIIGKHRYPEPGETRAHDTIRAIIDGRGEAHARMVMTTLHETSNNKALLDQVGLWAASDLVKACTPIVEQRTSDWLSVWDACPVGQLQAWVQDLRGIVPQRPALVGMVYERVVRRFGPLYVQPDLFDDRRIA